MRKRGWSLSTQATVLVTVGVTLAALVVGSLLLAGVYTLANEENDASLTAYRQMLVEGVNSRLEAVDRIAAGLADRDAVRTGPASRLGALARRAAAMNAEYLDEVAFTDLSGRVLASSGALDVGTRLQSGLSLPADLAGTVFLWQRAGPGGTSGRLWALSVPPDGGAKRRVVVLRVRTGFLESMLAEVSTGDADRVALLVDASGTPVMVGDAADRAQTLQADVPGAAIGTAHLRGNDSVEGFFATVTAARDLGWRIAVLDSNAFPVQRARRALLPGIGVMTLVSALAIGAVFLWSQRMIAPLRAFERRAKEVAAGGYIRPVRVDRDDEVGRLTDAFNRMGARLNSLQDMARLLAGGSDLDEVLDAVLDAIGHILGTGDAAVLLVDDDRTYAELARGHGLREPECSYRVPLHAPSPVSTAVIEQTPVEFKDPTDEWGRELYRLFDDETDRQGVAVPLVLGQEALGAIVVIAAGNRPLSEDQTESLRAYSSHAAVAVHTSRLFRQESVARSEAEALRRCAELVAGVADLEGVVNYVSELTCQIVGADGYLVAFAARESLGLEPSPDRASEELLLTLWDEVRPRGVDVEGPVVVDEADVPEGLRRDGLVPAVLVPLMRELDVGAVVALLRPAGAELLPRRALSFVDTIGKELSLGLENASLFAKARGRAANLETIFRISQAVSSSLQLSVVLNRVLDVVQKIFTADAVSLMAYDRQKHLISTSMARGVSSRTMLNLQVAPGQDIPGKVFAEGAAMSLRDLEEADTDLARVAVGQGMRSMLAVPLLARGRSIGVLSVFGREPAAFSGEDMELLLTFAAQAALAIDTAGMYGREHHVSSVLQSSILPDRLPEIEGMESSSFYLPVSTEAEIGGDFYDLMELPDGRILVSIGDVCGKGVLAATKTSMIKHSKRGMIMAGMSPGQALAELNTLVAVTGDPADIVTIWLGFIDPSRGTLTYANGGHPPALLRRADGSVSRLEATGPLLGALANTPFGEREVAIGEGDLLLTYTDGVTEARSEDEFFGEARVRAILEGCETAQDAVTRTLDALKSFTGGTLRDDAAGLAVRFAAKGSGGSLPADERGRFQVEVTSDPARAGGIPEEARAVTRKDDG